MKKGWCILKIDNYNKRLLVCSCMRVVIASPELRVCPQCKRVPEVQLVECADFAHNEPSGCGNPHCWKHKGKKDATGT